MEGLPGTVTARGYVGGAVGGVGTAALVGNEERVGVGVHVW